MLLLPDSGAAAEQNESLHKSLEEHQTQISEKDTAVQGLESQLAEAQSANQDTVDNLATELKIAQSQLQERDVAHATAVAELEGNLHSLQVNLTGKICMENGCQS